MKDKNGDPRFCARGTSIVPAFSGVTIGRRKRVFWVSIIVSLTVNHVAIGQESHMNTIRFLQIVRQISDFRDLREYQKVQDILGIRFTENRYGRRLDLRATSLPTWLADVNFVLMGSPPGSEFQTISLSPNFPLCVTPGDVRMTFGDPNLSQTYPPTIPTFSDEEAARAYNDEVEHGPGIVSMGYRLAGNDRRELSFYFGLRKCLQNVVESLNPLKSQPG